MRKPGMLQFEPDVRFNIIRGDSLEGLLVRPLVITGQIADADLPKLALRGQIVSYNSATKLYKPIFVMEITTRNGVGDYDGVQYGKVLPGATVHVMNADGTEGVDATVSSVEYSENTETAVDARVMSLVLDYGAGTEPTTPALILFDGMEAATMDGIIYESFHDVNIPVAVKVEGARPETIAGGATEFVIDGLGATLRSDVLFWQAY